MAEEQIESPKKHGNSAFEYVLASIGGLLGGPVGIGASLLVLYLLGKLVHGTSKWSLWFFIGFFGAPFCMSASIPLTVALIPESFWESQVAKLEAQVAKQEFQEGVENATNAANLVQTAESQPDWEQVADLWTAAIENMEAVPENSANKAVAQQKVAEYEKNLEYAQQVAQGFVDRGEKLFQDLNGDYVVMDGLTGNPKATLIITQSQWNGLTSEQRTDLESYARDRIKDINANPDKYLLRDIPRSAPVFDQMLEKYENTCASCWVIMVSYSDTKPYGLDETVARG